MRACVQMWCECETVFRSVEHKASNGTKWVKALYSICALTSISQMDTHLDGTSYNLYVMLFTCFFVFFLCVVFFVVTHRKCPHIISFGIMHTHILAYTEIYLSRKMILTPMVRLPTSAQYGFSCWFAIIIVHSYGMHNFRP